MLSLQCREKVLTWDTRTMTPQPVKTITISRTAWMDSPETLTVMMALCGQPDDQGDEARFVGGCVRDALLNRKVYDIDIATVFTPEEVIERLTTAKIKAIPTGIDHGTVTGVVNGHPFEITTLRCDVETYGRKAKVDYTQDWAKDAKRRDFTMNALYANIHGEVFDYVDGLNDAQHGIVRFIGDAHHRIEEDVLRILRFYRFYAHYGRQAIDQDSQAACRDMVKGLAQLSAERIQTEFLKLLMAENPIPTLTHMKDDGVFNAILQQITQIETLANLIALETKLDSKTYVIRRLAALIKAEAQIAADLSTDLKLSNQDQTALGFLCTSDHDISDQASDHDIRKKIYETDRDRVRNMMLLTAARKGVTADQIEPLYHLATKTRLPRFPMTGDDLLERGVTPGKTFGNILKTVETWWIDHDFEPGRTACLEQLDTILQQNQR